jgi:hypothetical protein
MRMKMEIKNTLSQLTYKKFKSFEFLIKEEKEYCGLYNLLLMSIFRLEQLK